MRGHGFGYFNMTFHMRVKAIGPHMLRPSANRQTIFGRCRVNIHRVYTEIGEQTEKGQVRRDQSRATSVPASPSPPHPAPVLLPGD